MLCSLFRLRMAASPPPQLHFLFPPSQAHHPTWPFLCQDYSQRFWSFQIFKEPSYLFHLPRIDVLHFWQQAKSINYKDICTNPLVESIDSSQHHFFKTQGHARLFLVMEDRLREFQKLKIICSLASNRSPVTQPQPVFPLFLLTVLPPFGSSHLGCNALSSFWVMTLCLKCSYHFLTTSPMISPFPATSSETALPFLSPLSYLALM